MEASEALDDGGKMMRVEFLPTARNVVGFPVERRERPTVDLLHRVAPAFYRGRLCRGAVRAGHAA